MSSDRRERYAAAMAGYMGHVHDVDGPTPEGYYPVADAAMAVADAEISEKLNGMQAQALRLVAATESLAEENAHLRAELEQARVDAAAWESTYELATREHHATIERVRAVLDDMGEDESASAIVEYARNALDGEADSRCGGCGEPANVGAHGINQGYGGCV
ncbi:hypothetical protein [Streptomyces sp. NPDC101393]|uniref:hypothetical protein n=1 Tax=Streptomyces sp. NPDC101393 TaxID=3366141 RepID=UPI0038015058